MAISFFLKVYLEIHNTTLIRIIRENPVSYSWEQCRVIAERIDQKYSEFLAGSIPITEVLSQPDDLILYILNRNCNNCPIQGISISINSTIPIGSGFGSSAAMISALSLVLRKITKKPFKNKKELISETRYIERLQHGKSGLIDSTTVVEGGIMFITSTTITKHENLAGEWWAIDTGKPESSTGECVAFVDKNFSNSSIWNEFNSVTNHLIENIKKNNISKIYDYISINHSLLQSIGVVPPLISQFIRSIEKMGGSAKVSGAGSIKGTKAGLVLVGGCNPQELSSLYGYSCHKIKGEKNGTMLAGN
ncbi:MAG: GHMP kinase [Candidatus Liberibacter europaeus]|uniref:GHMP kinase n=1 Tax=Candidatus Liberibacter europaeus TaxID=744859 RepID=A0A2T4VWC4_9HYPH|nr:GHMP kinase [Candidatus Liberibacter europaeus]PTL86075.1 MAG: GHMP kinase [Candidatus Liberibacter europaeus]